MTDATKAVRERSPLDRYFGLRESGSDVRTEFIAGVTTFLTMVYIVFVNPQILANAGMDKGAVFVATCIAAAVSTLVMALYANYPIALAPGMGLNAFFAFTVVLAYKYSWQQALAGVFCSGVLFFLISIFNIREYIINSIPKNLKLAISAGVGLFLGIIALEEAKIVVANPATLVTLGDLKQWPAILCLLGFTVIVALNYRRIIGATLIGILVVTLFGLPLGLAEFAGVMATPPSLAPTFLQLDFSRILELTFIIIVFSFLMVDVFDNAGTLIGVAHRAGLLDADGNLPRMKQALLADSFAAMFGALIGTSTTTSYIESAAGVSAGGRTGLTAVFVALFFLLALFFAPLAGMIPAYASAAALLYVACVMTRGLAEIDWEDITEYAPAVVAAGIGGKPHHLHRRRGGLGVAEIFAPHPVERILVRKVGDEAVGGDHVGEGRTHRFEAALQVFECGARLALHIARHRIEFLGPMRVVVIDRRRGDAGEIDGRAALDLDRGRVGHPHVGRVRPVHVLDRLCHAVPPIADCAVLLLSRECLLDREKIPPGKALLQRLAQEICRMQRRHRADLAGAGVKGEPAPARLEDTVLAVEQRLGRRIAEADQYVGVGELDLAQRERQADRGFLRRGRAIAGRAPRHDVGDIDRGAVEPDRRRHAAEQ